MKIAITGGTGFVGRHLAARLEAGGHAVLSRRTGHGLDDADVNLADAKVKRGCEFPCDGRRRKVDRPEEPPPP